MMTVPDQWREYPCADYFASPFAVQGYWDDPGQLWLIEPVGRVREYPEAGFLQVGRPGVDDIGFGYRRGAAGFWALHRICGKEFQYLAPTIHEFLDGWLAGTITV